MVIGQLTPVMLARVAPDILLRVDCPFFSTIVLLKNLRFPPLGLLVFFVERRIPGKKGEGTPRILITMTLRL